MSPSAPRPLDEEAEEQILQFFGERLRMPVGFDIWTRRHSGIELPDRDPCERCDDQVALLRQFVRLSPLLSVTPYDIERHADRAVEAGIDMTPTTILRAHGRSIQFVGMPAGVLFSAFLDVMSYLSLGITPLTDPSRAALAELPAPVRLELLVAPYDNFSAYLVRIAGALAAESRNIRLRVVDASAYPIFSSLRTITEVPVLSIEGQRFVGVWEEDDLVEQIRRIAAGDPEPMLRAATYSTEFVTEADARRMAAEGRTQLPTPPPSTTPSGLYIPGR